MSELDFFTLAQWKEARKEKKQPESFKVKRVVQFSIKQGSNYKIK
jgi:hypothetical protein